MKWYSATSRGDGEEKEGLKALGTDSWCCPACYRRRHRSTGTTGNAPDMADLILPTPKAVARVRSSVERRVGAGEIILWEDVVGWLNHERKEDGVEGVSEAQGRRLVTEMFNTIAATPGSKTRVVKGKRLSADFLFPAELRDEVVIGYFRRSRLANAGACPPSTTAEGEALFSVELNRVVSNKEERGPRMAVGRAAGRIIRADVKKDESLLNVPPLGKPHNYAEEIAMDIPPVRETIAALPRTLVALTQSATDLPLYREITVPDDGNWQPGYVWDPAWPGERQPSAARDKEADGSGAGSTGVATTSSAQGVDAVRVAPTEVDPAAGVCPAAEALLSQPMSEGQAKHIDKTNRDTRGAHRQVLGMCTSM
ncbi:unnamed protein product, partial [Pylaiella littoralis]